MAGLPRMGPRTDKWETWEFLRPMDVNSSELTAPQGRVEELHARLNGLLDALDEAQLHGPAAYVSMAIDTIRRDNPGLDGTS